MVRKEDCHRENKTIEKKKLFEKEWDMICCSHILHLNFMNTIYYNQRMNLSPNEKNKKIKNII